MNYTLIADSLWYTGHVITGFAIITNHYHYSMGISFAFVGQLLTMVSRPLGRINNSVKEENQKEEEHPL